MCRWTVPLLIAELEEREAEIDNFLTFGQGGASFEASQWVAKMAEYEAIIENLRVEIRRMKGTDLYDITQMETWNE